jgi:hypothetical protein
MNEVKPWLPIRVVGGVIGMIGMIAIAFAVIIPFITFIPDAERSAYLMGVILLILGAYDIWIWRLVNRPLTNRNLSHVCGSLAVNGYALLCLLWGHPWMQRYGIVPLAALLLSSRVLYSLLEGRLGSGSTSPAAAGPLD